MKPRVAFLITCALVAGCAVGPDYIRPSIDLPPQIRGAADSVASEASLADQAWWETFGDPTLQSLIEEALRSGYDVRLVAWRVEEARANAGIANSEFFPRIQAGGGWTRVRASEFVDPRRTTEDLYNVQVGVSWEIDLWGRIRRLKEAALAQYLAAEETRRGVMLSLTADIARSYFQLRALDFQLEIAGRTTNAFSSTHELFNRRLETGLGSSLEVSSAAASLARTAATIPDLERQIEAQENLLAFLLGRSPSPVQRGAALNDQLLPPDIPAGLPSDLLRRRPDLRQAEQELIAANAEVGVAVAEYFPRISLTGVFGGLSPEVSDLFGPGKAWSAGAEILTPVIQGRRIGQQHRAAVARWEQAKVLYERSVNNAFAEVSTALVAYEKLAQVEKQNADAVAAYRDAADLANKRYLSGLADYLEVLVAQQLLFPAENALAQTRFERLATLAELYRALGGGWKLTNPEWTREAGNGD